MKNGRPTNALDDHQLAELLDELVGLEPEEVQGHIVSKVGQGSVASRLFSLLETECADEQLIGRLVRPEDHLEPDSIPDNPKGLTFSC